MRVLITGMRGFVGTNLETRLGELTGFTVAGIGRDDPAEDLEAEIAEADAIVHLAGENRPVDSAAFEAVNAGFTATLCEAITRRGRPVPLLFASSIQAGMKNPYGRSKRAGEKAIEAYAAATGNPARIYRLPNVFGKWCRPNYNSAVATFCHNLARGLPIQIDDPDRPLRLIYIDDLIDEIVHWLHNPPPSFSRGRVKPEYETTVGAVVGQIQAFALSRKTLVSEPVGTGLTRALYATFISNLPPDRFTYEVPTYSDVRGSFVEMLKTKDSGQFSYFTAHAGVTRGGHYHHTKTEKFLILKGEALFRFRHLLTYETAEVRTSGDNPTIVETIPGWTHDVTNVGDDEMIVMLWANEIFDRQRPDTIAMKV